VKNDLSLKLLILLFVGLTGTAYAQVELYKYRLEESKDKDLCVHMTKVFNRSFKTPWDRGYDNGLNPIPSIFGTPYDQVFERLPGVEYNKQFVFEMLLAKYPSSPEFDAVKWQEGRVHSPESSPPGEFTAWPILVTQIDIDNDGTKEWVVKNSFMFKAPTNSISGVGDTDFYGWDVLTIFPTDGLDLAMPLLSKQLTHGQKPGHQPRKLDNQVALQLRPFIYKGKTYLSAYQVVWKDKNVSRSKPRHYRIYPDREYLNILQVVEGSNNPHHLLIETANTENVCRIRMRMLNDTTPSKGN